MSLTTYLHQPFTGQLGNIISNLCEKDDYSSLTIVAAFARYRGVLSIKKYLDAFRDRNHDINVAVGIDLGETSYEALLALLYICNNLYIVHVSDFAQTFHPKIYAFQNNNSLLAIVGSNNLTSGGLWKNMESCSITTLDKNKDEDKDAITQLNEYFDRLFSKSQTNESQSISMRVKSKDVLDDLLNAGLIQREVEIKIKKEHEAKSKVNRESGYQYSHITYFAKSVPTALPDIEGFAAVDEALKAKNTKSVDASIMNQPHEGSEIDAATLYDKEYRTIWFEAVKLTGGSRNMLDLSKSAKVEKGDPTGTEYQLKKPSKMKGGVAFFGVEPYSKEDVNVTINYNGVDYVNNIVRLYKKGKKPNETWRLIMQGKNADGLKLTQAFEKDYLTNKILVFERIRPGYFAMTVYSESKLEEFKDASDVIARNGNNPKFRLFGLLPS